MSPVLSPRLTLAVRRLQRGFSLIELMVAMTNGFPIVDLPNSSNTTRSLA